MANDGGPAFPLQSAGPEFAPGYAGMSLRDWFAGMAVQVVVPECLSMDSPHSTKDAAAFAYAIADAMLAERTRPVWNADDIARIKAEGKRRFDEIKEAERQKGQSNE